MAAPSVAVAEHLRVAGLVARARRQEAAALLAACSAAAARSASVSAGAAVGGDQRDQVGSCCDCSARS
jgi:hypothetical protein